MNYLTEKVTKVLKLFGLSIFFQVTLFAMPFSLNAETIVSMTENTLTDIGAVEENISIALNSFGDTGVVMMLLLTSLLGAFFVKNEFDALAE